MILLSWLFACSTPISNPTGTCTTDENGSRSCYHTSADDYLLDCEAPLNREYWRVFAQNETSAYIIPRPDGAGLTYGLCDEESQLGELFIQYALCQEPLTASLITVINDIPPEDALTITNALHTELEFVVNSDGLVSPFAPPDDIVDVCNMTDDNDDVVLEYCTTALEYYDSENDCPNIAFLPSEEVSQVIANRMNTLYGINTTAE
jgi:hypothetical protein